MICMYCRTELTSEEESMHTCRGRVEFVQKEEARIRAGQAEREIAERLGPSKIVPLPLYPDDMLSGPDDLYY